MEYDDDKKVHSKRNPSSSPHISHTQPRQTAGKKRNGPGAPFPNQSTAIFPPLRSPLSNNFIMRNSANAAAHGAEEEGADIDGSKRRRMTTRGRSPPSNASKPTKVFEEDNADDNPENQTASQKDEIPEPPQQPVLLGAQPRGLYECDYCHSDLTRSPRVRCAICPDFDLCLDCLATTDHVEMCRTRRGFQLMHRKNEAKIEPSSGKKKKGRPGKKKVEEEVEMEEDPNILGYYHNGHWVPFFRHKATHGYVVADSTRYTLFPPFRGVMSEEDEVLVKNELETRPGTKQEAQIQNEDDNVSEKIEGKCEQNHPSGVAERANQETKDAAPDSSSEKTEAALVSETTTQYCNDTNNKVDANEGKTDVEMEEAVVTEATSSNSMVDSKDQEDKLDNERFDKKISLATKESIDIQRKRSLRLADDLKNPWTIEEDLRLLDSILTCGLGNWPEIAEHVNGGSGDSGSTSIGGKTDKMCMERYLDDFLGRYGHILPPYTMVPIDDEEAHSSDIECVDVGRGLPISDRKRLRRSFPAAEDDTAPGFKKKKFRVVPTDELDEAKSVWPHPYIPSGQRIKLGDEVARDLWYRSEQAFVRQCSSATSYLDVEKIRQDFIKKRKQNMEGYEAEVLPPRIEDLKSYPGSELAGYMPRREDFDFEHDNDAELLIADMEFSADDSKEDKDLKVEVIKIFNSKLDERQKRKDFILKRKLTNYRENQEQFQKLPADERHLIHRMRLFERFHSVDEHRTFIDNVLKAKRLRKEIAKLQMYRRLGIVSLADAEKYELDKSRREYHKMAWLKKEAETKKAEADAARQAKENASDVDMCGLDGGIGIAANISFGIWKQYKQDGPGSWRKIIKGIENAEASPGVSEPPDFNLSKEEHPESDEKMKAEVTTDSDAFILEDKPGFDVLSLKEKGLCTRLQLFPQHYLAVKKALINESLSAGIFDPSNGHKGKTFVTVDVSKCDDIIDFVLKAGWISDRPAVKSATKEETAD